MRLPFCLSFLIKCEITHIMFHILYLRIFPKIPSDPTRTVIMPINFENWKYKNHKQFFAEWSLDRLPVCTEDTLQYLSDLFGTHPDQLGLIVIVSVLSTFYIYLSNQNTNLPYLAPTHCWPWGGWECRSYQSFDRNQSDDGKSQLLRIKDLIWQGNVKVKGLTA